MINIDSRNICLLNFSDILNSCERKILDDLYTFDLLEKFSFKNQDVKKIFYYHIIHGVCNIVLHTKTVNKIIISYCDNDIKCFSNIETCNDYRFRMFVTTLIKKIKKLIPVKMFITNLSFNNINDIINKKSGEYKELINNLQIIRSARSSIEFNGIKNLSKKYELTYLSREFFDEVKTKNLFFI
jgi:hypothetical protein